MKSLKLDLLIVAGRGILPSSGRLGSAGAEVVVVHRRVEQQKETTLGLMPPHRVVREHHHVTLADRNIYNRRLAGKLRPARKHSADQQILLAGVESQHDPRTHIWRRNQRSRELTQFFGNAFFAGTRLLLRPLSGLRHRLDDVRISHRAATRRALTRRQTAAATTSAAAKAAGRADVEQRGLTEIHRKRIAVAVRDRALLISKRRAKDRAARIELTRVLNRHARRDSVVDRNLRDAR